ncbi:hypothetical protein BGZ94_009691 [Podila epigama]|nr:hypothetical protein BGZ94_009691 [Podila epigama]
MPTRKRQRAEYYPSTITTSPNINTIDTASERAENYRRLQRVQEIAAAPRSHSSGVNLDFGRFKRDLERRQRSDSPATFMREQSQDHLGNHGQPAMGYFPPQSKYNDAAHSGNSFVKASATSRLSSARSGSNSSDRRTAEKRTLAMVDPSPNSIVMPDNPFQISSTPSTFLPAFTQTTSYPASVPTGATEAAATSLRTLSRSEGRPSVVETTRHRKRSLSSMLSLPTESIQRATSERPRTLGRDMSRSSSRMSSRSQGNRSRLKSLLSTTVEDEADFLPARRNKRLREATRANDDGSEEFRNSSIDDPLLNDHIQSTSTNAVREPRDKSRIPLKQPSSPIKPFLIFDKPKPPGKNRTDNVQRLHRRSASTTRDSDGPAQARDGAESSSRTESLNNSFERPMHKVQGWMTERNPSLLSPPLTSSSETIHRSLTDDERGHDDTSKIRHETKRKAQYQLRGKDPKRHASSEQIQNHHRRSSGHIPLSSDSTHTLYPTSLSVSSSRPSDPSRDQQDPDTSTLPPVDWSQFKLRHPSPRIQYTKTSPAPLNRSYSSPQRSRPVIVPKTPKSHSASAIHSDVPSLSPLVRLRQSQLQRRQQEDFLGIKRQEGTSSSQREREEDELAATLQFNQVLEKWEREDDETLARNAAREADEIEQQRQQQRQHQTLDDVLSRSTRSDNGTKKTPPTPRHFHKPMETTQSVLTTTTTTPSTQASVPSLHEFSFRPSTPSKSRGDLETRSTPFPTTSRSNFSISKTPSSTERPHRGLFTPSKKASAQDRVFSVSSLVPPASPFKTTPTTPTMSRYTQLSSFSDGDEDEEHES